MAAPADPADTVVRFLTAAVRPLVGAFAVVWVVNAVAIAWNPWDFPRLGADATIAFEGGPWTWLSTVMLLGIAVFVHAATRHRPDRGWWVATSLLFVYFAADEGLRIHEQFDDLAGTSETRHYGWALPGLVVVTAVAFWFGRWVLGLERELRNRLVVAGGVFLAGALVVEVAAGMWQTAHGEDRVFFVITTVEETCEVVGALLAARAVRRAAPLRSPAAAG